jgi:hypothetical protein
LAYKNKADRQAYLKAYQRRPEVKARRAVLQKARRSSPEGRAKGRDSDLRRRYGLSTQEYNALFVAQGSKCAICRSTKPGVFDWHVDHDHKTGKVRGILCKMCNWMLGAACDATSTLRAAAFYLEKHKA